MSLCDFPQKKKNPRYNFPVHYQPSNRLANRLKYEQRETTFVLG